MENWKPLLAGAALLLATGCASTGNTSKPYSIVDVISFAPSLDTHKAHILGFDGKLNFTDRPPHWIDPGFHTVLVATAYRGPQRQRNPELTLYLLAKPCRKYFIAAKHECSNCSNWEPIISKVQDIEGCTMPDADQPEAETN